MTTFGTANDALLERDGEIGVIARAAQAAARGSGTVLLIEGPAGIGKTALLDVARRLARESEAMVLAERGGELEQDFGFGVVDQLFGTVARTADQTGLFAGRARLAAPILGLDLRGDEQADHQGERIFPALHGLYWLTVNLAERQPLVLVVDDAHLADSASLRFLAHLGHRIDGLPVLLIAATRSGADSERVARALSQAEIVRPRPLSAAATAVLVRSVAPEADREVCSGCHAATGGNAFYALELAKAVQEEGLVRGRASARRLVAWSPASVNRSVSARLDRLSPASRELARAASVLEERSPVRHAAAVAGLDPALAAVAADELTGAGILAPRRPLEFAHPIVRAAVYGELAPGERARQHAHAAQLLADEQVPAERVALHIVHSEPQADPLNCPGCSTPPAPLLHGARRKQPSHTCGERSRSLLGLGSRPACCSSSRPPRG